MKNFFLPTVFSLLLLGAVCLYVFLVEDIASSMTAIAAAKESALQVGAEADIAHGTDIFMADTAAEQTELETFVVKDSESVRIVNAIDDAATRAHVTPTIGSVSVLPTSWQYHEPVEVVVSAKGSAAALTSFATLLQSLPEASELKTMSLEASTNNSWFGKFIVDFVKEKPVTP